VQPAGTADTATDYGVTDRVPDRAPYPRTDICSHDVTNEQPDCRAYAQSYLDTHCGTNARSYVCTHWVPYAAPVSDRCPHV
jgi:hypothetical protein